MRNERILELSKLATRAISLCQDHGQPDNPVLGFWKGVKMVLDEVMMDTDTPQEGMNAMMQKVQNQTSFGGLYHD